MMFSFLHLLNDTIDDVYLFSSLMMLYIIIVLYLISILKLFPLLTFSSVEVLFLLPRVFTEVTIHKNTTIK